MNELQTRGSNYEVPKSKSHYTYVTRSIIRLFTEGALTNVLSIDVEPEYGYTTRLNYVDGSVRITYGNDLGLNPADAEVFATDKWHTKYLLNTLGISCPDGESFLLPWWQERIGESQTRRGNTGMRSIADADIYLQENFGYPAYIKPVNGSKGGSIYKVNNLQELQTVIHEYNTNRIRVALIEKPIDLPDYRIVMLDGEMISAYRRDPLAVVGNGQSTVGELLIALQEQYFQEGRDTNININDPRIATELSAKGLELGSIIELGEKVILVPVSNLSMGGSSLDVSGQIDTKWVELCAYIAKNMNLRLCGVDLACGDIEDASTEYSIIEVNASPGLDHYASSGEEQSRIVDELYTRVLNTL